MLGAISPRSAPRSLHFGNFHSNDTEATGPAKDGLPVSANIGIGPYTMIILSQ